MRENLGLLAAKWHAVAAQMRFLPRALAMVQAAVGVRALLWLALLCVQGLAPAAVVYLSRPLVDHMSAAMGTGGDWANVAPTLSVAAAIAIVLLLMEGARSAAEWMRADLAARVEDHVSSLIHARSTSVDLAFYDAPDFHDHLHRARDEARYRPTALLENGGALVQNGITLLAMAAVLAPYGAWMSVALLVSTLPAFLVVVRFAVIQHRWRVGTTVDERRAHYFDWLMTSGDAAAELRLFGLGARLREAYQSLRARLRGEQLKLARGQAGAEAIAGAGALAIAAACVAWMGWRAMHGETTLGDVALFYLAFSQGQRLMRSLLAGVGQIYYNMLFLGNLFEFLDLRRQIEEPANPRPAPVPTASGLEVRFDGVTFLYPGSGLVALRNFTLAVPAGQVAAIVGANGAGKSTVLKLLCRFYDPQSGRVALAGVDVRSLAMDDVRRMVTALFQQPVHYNASVAENIAPHGGASADDIAEAARAAGAEEIIARLPEGYATLLGRWFAGGVELSVGEWQRLALARAFLRRSPVIVLDEPTSAMDSWAETDWMQRFRGLASGRTAIIVTHRFTTAMQADVIHVMDKGRIVESGTHHELVAREGRYARSWSAQMRATDARAPLRVIR